MIATLGAKTWAYTKNGLIYYNFFYGSLENAFFNGNSFKGSFTHCTDGCSGDYGTLASNGCNEYNFTNSNADRSICVLFLTLYGGMIVFVIAEVIAMIAIIVWGLVLLCFNNKVNCFWLTYCCSGCAWVAHYIGTLFWLGITSANYNADCSVTPYNGKGPTVCTGDGPALALFTLIFLPVIVVLFCIVGCHAQRKHNLMLITQNNML